MRLADKARSVPAGVDLSGQWRLRADAGDTLQRIEQAERDAAGGQYIVIPKAGSTRTAPRRPPKAEKGSRVHVFLESSDNVKLTQTADGMFISYGRSIVEEYRFGEHRVATVGPIAAERVSGWDGESFVVETLDGDGAQLTETWSLQRDGAELKRQVRVTFENRTTLDVTQMFDRAR